MQMNHGKSHTFFFQLPPPLLLFAFSVLCFVFVWNRQRKCQRAARLPLPPGSMGWPHLGETLQLYSQDPNVFFASKQKRYGEIFKTHLLGCPCVMLASPEAARFVLVTQAHLFKPTYPRSKEQMIGPSALFFHQGDYHTRLRKLVQGSLSPEAIRRLIPDVEATVVSMLESWDGRLITTFDAMKRFSFDVGIITIFGRPQMDARLKEELKKNYFLVDKGYNSFPTNIPGTAYSKAVMARKRLRQILSQIMKERREKGILEKDLLGCLMSSQFEKGEHLSDDKIADNVIGVLFAAQDTTASVLTWILKYLHDNDKLLEAVKNEQMAIYQYNRRGDQPLTWSQTRNMPLTHRVILETLRMASIISFTFREAVADVEYKGYLIPRGWKVMPLFRNIHHNPEFFHDPHNFDPSRFTVSPKPNTFLPFGNGVHACPGNELAKLEMLVLIHHLVTKYRWQIAGKPNEIEYGPFPVPRRGLPARFSKISSSG
uniref:(+)-abscisic acid 8'-hydroxylase n=1 Tax=Anthurium amnicola TaxID=1678845 RepID=A0A1D1YN06_9ARAE